MQFRREFLPVSHTSHSQTWATAMIRISEWTENDTICIVIMLNVKMYIYIYRHFDHL